MGRREPLVAPSPRWASWNLMGMAILGTTLLFQARHLPALWEMHGQSESSLSPLQEEAVRDAIAKCESFHQKSRPAAKTSRLRSNPRWQSSAVQHEPFLLRNATLFDGEDFIAGSVDILIEKGVVVSVSPTSNSTDVPSYNLHGKYVTPGLVDMHGHQAAMSWPGVPDIDDANEIHPSTGPLTPFLRVLDSFKAEDMAVPIIASGGVTSSLILPGSANIMAGEATLIKNKLGSGQYGENVVDDLLLERGVPKAERRRYMKMAWGENPKTVYEHTRMGNSWILRHHLSRAKAMQEKQDKWCHTARQNTRLKDLAVSMESHGMTGPEALELESTIGVLRGHVAVHVHCYLSNDFSSLLRIAKEFGFRISAFHHALDAWKVPQLLKEENVTIATFSTFGLYKQEAYNANLWAGKILADAGLPVAYKSDHCASELNAKYLMFQAATAHSFHLDQRRALQAVTSVPSRSLRTDDRIGFVRPGYDADIVVWDSHPLSLGATPLEVFIDGQPTLPHGKLEEIPTRQGSPQWRPVASKQTKSEICGGFMGTQGVVIQGIRTSYLAAHASTSLGDISMVIRKGRVVCFGSCDAEIRGNARVVTLNHGYILPGLTAVTSSLGVTEIALEQSTGDGSLGPAYDATSPEKLAYAKYGIHFGGKSIDRARIAGITKAVTTPLVSDFSNLWVGVSVGFRIGQNMSILNGGIIKDDVALHLAVGQSSKNTEVAPTISLAIGKIHALLREGRGIYGLAANGSIPLVVKADNMYDILQLIRIKREHQSVNLVIFGAAEASAVANELAEANIPVILNSIRGSPETWEIANVLSGPPLTESPVQVLQKAGVLVGLAISSGLGESHIHNLLLEAAWAGKYTGLSAYDSVSLVSRNIERMLNFSSVEDMVVVEGNPLEFGSSVVAAIDGESKRVLECWPTAT